MYGRLLVEPAAASKARGIPDDEQLRVRTGAGRGVQPRQLLHGQRPESRLAQVPSRPPGLPGVGRVGAGERAHDGAGRRRHGGAARGGRQRAAEANGCLTWSNRISDADARRFDLAAYQFHLADPVALEIPQNDAALILQGMISHKSQAPPPDRAAARRMPPAPGFSIPRPATASTGSPARPARRLTATTA